MNKLYDDTYIQDIAQAIREKNGTNDTYTVSQMGNAIRDLNTSQSLPNLIDVSIDQNGIYTPPPDVDGFNEVTVDVPPTVPDLETLTATENGNYTPSSDKDGFSEVNVQVSGAGANLKPLIVTEDDIYIPSNNYNGFNLVISAVNPYGHVTVDNSNLIVNGSIIPISLPLSDDIVNDGFKANSSNAYFSFKLDGQWLRAFPFMISMIGKFDNTTSHNKTYIVFNGSNDSSGGEFIINNTDIGWYAHGSRSSVPHNLVCSDGAEYLFSLKFDFISNKISYVLALTETSDIFTYEYEYDLTGLLNCIQDPNTIIAINKNPHNLNEYSNATVNSIIIQGLSTVLPSASGVSF